MATSEELSNRNAMVKEEEDSTPSAGKGEGGNMAQSERRIMPEKCESRSPPSNSGNDDDDDDDDEDESEEGEEGEEGDEGLKPVTTGGKGLWSLWTRNFKSPLLMALDLIDNAVDAALHPTDAAFSGRVRVYRDAYAALPGRSPPGRARTTGLCIRNNAKCLAPLRDVLQLFISAKAASGSESIGENGVGLKQSCAALSDLSFVLVRNGAERHCQLGVIAKSLQKRDGVYLPCFEFCDGAGGKTLRQQLLETFAQPRYAAVAACVAEYGRVQEEGAPSLARGVARLNQHFSDMTHRFFDSSHVFEVIIDKMVHRGQGSEAGGAEENAAVRDLLDELQREIPRRYLHIDDDFHMCVGHKELTFKYWPERLVEFTKIFIPVRSKTPWCEDFGEMTEDTYMMGVFLGFDRYRITDPGVGFMNQRACSLYIYSRSCGRLIQYESDARNILGLTSGGTDFCQGLTILIDDVEGRLPLDPTKQGIAFGNEASGHVHRENLNAVVSCVAKFYYKHNLKKFGRKTLLSEKIKDFVHVELPKKLKTCGNSELTDYGVRFIHTKDNRIQVDRTFTVSVDDGPDTFFKLETDGCNHSLVKKKLTPPDNRPMKKTKKAAPTKRVQKLRKERVKTKPQVARSCAPPAKRKIHASKVGKSHGRERKKNRVAQRTHLPPKTKGTRSSPRRTRTNPVRYCDESYSEPGSDDEDGGNDVVTNMDKNKVKMEANVGRNDEHPIDLCSSSDEDDEEMNEVALAPSHVLSNSLSNDSEGEEAVEAHVSPNSLSENSDGEEAVGESAPDPRRLKLENAEVKRENTDLKTRLIVLATENDSLGKEIKNLRKELEQSKHTVSVIK